MRHGRSGVGPAFAALVAALAAGCTVGPDYVRPSVVTPDAYKENVGWKVAEPRDHTLRGSWWELFGDPQLNALEEQVSISNQNLLVAEATYRQARALVRQARAAYFPTVTAGVGYTRSRQSDTLGSASGTSSSGRTTTNQPVSTFQLPIDVAWTPDFWGRVRRTVESGRDSAQASAGDLETARLSFQAELAQDYFQLRMLDAQRKLLDDTVIAFDTALRLTKNRYASGVASRVDVVQAETQLKTTMAQA
ncbi:MAG TPA: TolC family protein, partial [Candidatus Dormibacteraeota bacterium]|nr:TolC family protein [Candidatus Dormibacteraeota bacterium]